MKGSGEKRDMRTMVFAAALVVAASLIAASVHYRVATLRAAEQAADDAYVEAVREQQLAREAEPRLGDFPPHYPGGPPVVRPGQLEQARIHYEERNQQRLQQRSHDPNDGTQRADEDDPLAGLDSLY
jgi:hypothetical protein